ALSVPAFAGIPVTHRDFVSSVHIITGHQKENEPLKIDFDFLAKTTGTLVFLMGMASLKQITDGLISKGLDKKTPAAIIENGSRPNQRKLVADIESLYDKAVANHFKSPSIIIVGQVCKLSDQYDWFSKRPLFHEKIIVTRPKDSGGTLSKKLRELGAEVIDYPCIEIKEMEAREQLNSKISNIKTYTWLVFTSKNGVQIFFDYLRNQKKDLRILSDMKIAAIGSQTAKSLLDYGIIADYVPEIFDVEHLAQGLCEIVSSEDNILILRSAKGNEAMNELFNIKGIHFCDLAIYDTICASERNEMIAELINKSEEIYVTFTSASTVTGFMNSIDNNVEINRITGICIGSQTAKEAEKYNIKHHIAAEATIDSLIQKIAEVQNERNKA
ncbi:MAG: uroporphyrinogen-III synthase, partial [Clostridiales bacterium]|nr:uroporphyrinogen-III synthase [Clostridiales bacterium]